MYNNTCLYALVYIKSFWYNCILKPCGGAYSRHNPWVSYVIVASTTKPPNNIASLRKVNHEEQLRSLQVCLPCKQCSCQC
jgi:hypothetical protein